MQLIVFILAYPLLWLVSRLPFPILYVISDRIYQIVYHLVGYRKKVVRENLKLTLPERSDAERLAIEKKFYRHMCDMFLEMIKTLGMNAQEMERRFTYTNLEVLQNLEKEGKRVLLMASHYASWEWILPLNAKLKAKGYVIYLKIQNKYFDKQVRDIRSKYGCILIRTNESRKIIKEAVSKGEKFTLGIASDQSPMISRARHWSKFMDIMVPVHIGAEELAKEHNLTPVYLKVDKLKRGHYQGTFKVLTETPRELPNYQITDMFLAETEKSIREAPEYYFWTHKRWKHRHKVPPSYLEQS